MIRRSLLVVVMIACALAALAGQAIPRIDTNIALKQIVKRVEPSMPAIATAAKVSGKVIADLTVGLSGAVESVAIVLGNPLFDQAAVSALKQWTFKPFLVQGRPARVIVLIELSFGTPTAAADRRISDGYVTAMEECERQVELRAPAAELACAQLASLAEQMPPGEYLLRMDAYASYAHAFLVLGMLPDALHEYERALAIATEHLRPDQAEYAGAMSAVATLNDILGNTAKADEQYAKAIASYERAMVSVPRLREPYARNLSAILERSSALKRRIHQLDAAAALDAKRAALVSDRARPEVLMKPIAGVLCLGAGCASATAPQVEGVLAVLPKNATAWMLIVQENLADPYANATVYLEPTVTSGGLMRGPVGLVTRPFGDPGGPRPTTGWRYGPMFGAWAQVLGPGANPRTFASVDDPNLPFQIVDRENQAALADADVVAIVTQLREAGAKTAKAALPEPRIYTDVQPWRIVTMSCDVPGEVRVTLADRAGKTGLQTVRLKRVQGQWAITEVSR